MHIFQVPFKNYKDYLFISNGGYNTTHAKRLVMDIIIYKAKTLEAKATTYK